MLNNWLGLKGLFETTLRREELQLPEYYDSVDSFIDIAATT